MRDMLYPSKMTEQGDRMNHTMKIAGLARTLELFPVSDETSIAAFIIFGDVEMTKTAASQLLAKAPEFDVILTAEAKAIPLAYEMAAQAGLNDYVIARKGMKVYMRDAISTDVESITTQHLQKLYLGADDVEKLNGKRVLIVDDVISTGASLESLEELCRQAGGNVAGKMAILAEGDAINREDIIVLGQLPLFNADGSVKE